MCRLSPSISDEVYQRIDQPLSIDIDPIHGRHFLKCDYNRDGDSYRSPFSNHYFPPIAEDEEAFYPSERVRNLEIQANELFDVYRELYYQGGHSSAYLWDVENGLAACIVFRKDVSEARVMKVGSWNAIHIIEVQEDPKELDADGKRSAVYQLTSTIQLDMELDRVHLGMARLSGQLTRQSTKTLKYRNPLSHLKNFGRMIEELENDMRLSMDSLYIAKTREVMNGMRRQTSMAGAGQNAHQIASELAGAVQKHGMQS